MWTSAIQTLAGKMSIGLLRPTIDNGLSWRWVHHWPRNTSYNMRRFQEAQAKARSGNDAKMRCFFSASSFLALTGQRGAVGWRDQKLHQAVNKLSRNTPEDLSSWPVLTECCYPSFDCLVNPNHQNSGDGTFLNLCIKFNHRHHLQKPTEFLRLCKSIRGGGSACSNIIPVPQAVANLCLLQAGNRRWCPRPDWTEWCWPCMPWRRHVENFGDACLQKNGMHTNSPRKTRRDDTSIRTVCSFISE